MIPPYQRTKLWTLAFADRPDDEFAEARNRLRTTYHGFRERASLLAAEIPQDLRDFTRHDATHLDALWDMADLVAGEISLNPIETFVLGGSFLLHDLGMGIAALPNGFDDVTREDGWLDIVASSYQEICGVQASSNNLSKPPPPVLQLSKETALREKHADRAADLAFTSWTAAAGGTTYFLIEEIELRTRYGHLIGRIAASHGWDLDRVAGEFSATVLGSSGDFPPGWTVDPLKLACLMRLADACHIDDRRAPGFLRAIRQPGLESSNHWVFQEHLHRPFTESDYIVYTAAQPFQVSEASAWWLCFETIQVIDKEVSSVDALLIQHGRPRMAIRGVRGADTPDRLSKLIPAEGWTPVDARVVVGDVPRLVRSLGGENLYGDDLKVPIRELIQNGADACRALKHVINDAPHPTIRVELKQENDGDWWLTVADNGVGMSQNVMANVLLDFGRSFWGSQLMRREIPGLAASSFQATGKFGIGFYSVFMLGDQVKVISRRFDEASTGTRVLEFAGGVGSRPILRPARYDEVRHAGGTAVSVRLRDHPRAANGLLDDDEWYKESLERCCAWLAPALDADLVVSDDGGPDIPAVRANDWLSMDAKELLLRISTATNQRRPRWAFLTLEEVADAVTTLEEDGVVVARVALPPEMEAGAEDGPRHLFGVAVAGGLRIGDVDNVCGVLLARPITADRGRGEVLASPRVLEEWATGQAKLCEKYSRVETRLWMLEGPATLAALNAETGRVYICATRDGFRDAEGLQAWASQRDTIVVTTFGDIDFSDRGTRSLVFWDESTHQKVMLRDNVVVVPENVGYGSVELINRHPDQTYRPERDSRGNSRLSGQEWWY